MELISKNTETMYNELRFIANHEAGYKLNKVEHFNHLRATINF